MKKIVLILCFLWICFIAFNTSQSGTVSNNTSVSITEKLVNKIQDIFNKNEESNSYINSSEFIRKLNKLIRKVAHGFEFLVLAILISFALESFNIKNREVIIYTLFFVLLYAVIDEFRQIYIPGRNSNVKDIVIDFIGGIGGVIIFQCVFICKNIYLKKKSR